MRIPQVLGQAKHGIYLLQADVCVGPSSSKDSLGSLYSCLASECNSLSSDASLNSNVRLWHNRLSHLPISSTKTISSISSISDLLYLCDVCPLARQSKLPFPTSSIKTKYAFELIYIDTWGPYNSPTYDGYKYFLTIIDDFTRWTWTYFLALKAMLFT